MAFSVLVSPKEVVPHLGDRDWAIIDCRFDLKRPDWGEAVYLYSHISGAAYLHLERDLSATPTGSNGRHPLPSVERLTGVFSHLGIGPDTQVVAYDDSGGPFAARLWWCLQYLGHEAAAVLDGGLPAWRLAGYPLRGGQETRRPAAFQPAPRVGMIAQAEEIRGQLGLAKLLLIDARSPERFRGEEEPYDPVAGHIPGASNHYWKDNLDPRGQFLPAEELRAKFETILQGIPANKVVSYCGSGVTGAHNLLAMAHAGLSRARLYPGSWSEWCANPSNPITSGKKKRPSQNHLDEAHAESAN